MIQDGAALAREGKSSFPQFIFHAETVVRTTGSSSRFPSFHRPPFGYNGGMEDTTRILVAIKDDIDINEMVATSLRKAGYTCDQAFSGSEARLLLQAATANGDAPFDLVITDLMLPGASGEDLVREIRLRSDAPIIVVSARSGAGDKVELLKLGADDYLAKPFDLDELHARIIVQLRHAARGTARSSATLRFKDWVLDTEARTLTAAGAPVKLTRLEYGIVETLVRRPKKVFTKQELLRSAWNDECFVEEKAATVHVSNIRSKLKASGTDGYLKRYGYRIQAGRLSWPQHATQATRSNLTIS